MNSAATIFSLPIQKAVRFAIRTHEGYQKQKRKGKDIPYITHPLLVGLTLARAGASEAVIAAGILHDTIEDSPAHKKVTREMLVERFGEAVASLVESVTEKNKTLSWDERKLEAFKHIDTFSDDAVLVKSADTICNLYELIADYEKEGEVVFERFSAPKDKVVENYRKVMRALRAKMPTNPFTADFEIIEERLSSLLS